MKRKLIEKIPWQCSGKKKKMVVVAKVHNIRGEDVLLVDFALDKPVIRIALSHKDFENYIPDNSPCEGVPKWNRRKYANLRNDFGLLYSAEPDWNTQTDRGTADIIHQFVYGNDCFCTNWNHDIDHLQYEIILDKQKRVEDRRREKIEEKMATVPEPTKSFRNWAMGFVEKHVMYMLPFRKKKVTKATCSACQGEHEYEKGKIMPRQLIICPSCGAECTVKRIDYENKNPIPGYEFAKEVLLFQKIGEEFCQRHFYVIRWVDIDGEGTKMTEIGRIFYPAGRFDADLNKNPAYETERSRTYYNKYNPWNGSTFWDDKNLLGMSNIVLGSGPVYPVTISKKMFEGTRYQYCAMEKMKSETGFAPIDYLKKYSRMPQAIEMMIKMGLYRMAMEISPMDFKGDGKPWERLGISKIQLNRLRKINGGWCALEWMRYEESTGKVIDDETIGFFEKDCINPKDVDFITDRMGGRQVMYYIIRQRKQRKIKTEEILRLWRDYLSMALRMKMDVQQELIYRPKDVKQAHDDAVKLCGGADVAKRAGEIIQKYPDVDMIMLSIKEKYEYSDDKYAVVVPGKIEDIIHEGRRLGHCLDKSDIYFDRIQRRESFIVFLRKTEDIEKPYYTMEIEPDGTTRQKRTTGDRQDKDFQEAVSFIRKWQREVRRRLDETDKVLAVQSAELREEEFKDLRKKQTKVWHGMLAGKLLADVLEADLMIAGE